ncbi:hypothetical protein R9C00_20635 [Flammeovirgaceae bacterium SG7u.111]|nr:hypothetical protein [Flammeovirgaceae bacterium SG7u.132]WPO34110.1 hypothetical protein R9C00_20635 [Flammeovirgaceae bacterium SG7u.111]
MKKMKLIIALLFVSFFASAQVAKEKKGFVEVEAEDFVSQTKDDVRKWYVVKKGAVPEIADENLLEGASGDAYIEILPDTRKTHDDKLTAGVNFSNEAGQMAIVSYKVKFKTTGKYYVWVRTHSTGSEDNGVHVGLDGEWPESGNRMQWCEGKKQWTWDSKQRTEEVHCGVEKLIYLDIKEKGEHTISFSMREDGFSMDKWAMSLEYESPEER